MRNHSTTESTQGVIGETGSSSGHRIRTYKTVTWGKGLTKIEKFIQYANAEPERVDRDPFVHAVEHASEIKIGRQP